MEKVSTVLCKKYGDASVWSYGESSSPKLKAGCVLVSCHASSINPVDWKIRQGKLRPLSGFKPPRIPGADFAGKIIEVGSGVVDYKKGDRVFGMLNPLQGGAWSNRLVVPTKQMMHMPLGLSMQDAAALPLAGMTAFQALVKIGQIRAGLRVLIRGCTGGVGSFAVQIAKIYGCEVVGTCRTENKAFASSIGVDQVIDYTQNPEFDHIAPVDVFFDVCGHVAEKVIDRMVVSEGMYITTQPDVKQMAKSCLSFLPGNIKRKVVVMHFQSSDLSTLANLVADGRLKVLTAKSYPLTDIVNATQYFELGGAPGKVVLTMDQA